MGVTSLPVPAVVGTQASGSARLFRRSTPIVSMSCCLPSSSAATSLATSIALPPPSPTTPSVPAAFACAMASWKFSMVGSPVSASQTVTRMFRASSAPMSGVHRPRVGGVVTRKTEVTPRVARSSAQERTTPWPILTVPTLWIVTGRLRLISVFPWMLFLRRGTFANERPETLAPSGTMH